MARRPGVFVSHGSPMHALEPGAAGAAWAALGRRLGKPKAIVVASAHWETHVPMLTGAAKPETVHDFFGFPAPLFELQYPAPGSIEVARRAQALLAGAGFTAAIDGLRGLDHGAWSPLLHMYPDAGVPVVQVSVQPALGPRHHLALGRALAPLRDEGVLVMGSGHLTHNLRDWDRSGCAKPLAYAVDFQNWVFERISKRDLEDLVEYRSRAPHAVRAHPSEEHFLPLFVALGAAGPDGTAERIHDAIEDGALAMDAYVFQ